MFKRRHNQGATMGTLLENAQAGQVTEDMVAVAENEGVPPELVRDCVADGSIVIAAGRGGPGAAVGIGRGLRTKVNASIGTSSDIVDLEMELEKARVAWACGADTLMELSTGGDLDEIRRRILGEVPMPAGSVPLYQAAADSEARLGSALEMTDDLLFEVIEKQARDGI